jgi:hypothetical protein
MVRFEFSVNIASITVISVKLMKIDVVFEQSSICASSREIFAVTTSTGRWYGGRRSVSPVELEQRFGG